jgi:hypothetical protein
MIQTNMDLNNTFVNNVVALISNSAVDDNVSYTSNVNSLQGNQMILKQIERQLCTQGYVVCSKDIVNRLRNTRRMHNKINKQRRAQRKQIRIAKYTRLNVDGDSIEHRTKFEKRVFAALKVNMLDYIFTQLEMFPKSLTCKQNQWSYAKHLYDYYFEVSALCSYWRKEINDFIWAVGRYSYRTDVEVLPSLDKYLITLSTDAPRKRTIVDVEHECIVIDDSDPVYTKKRKSNINPELSPRAQTKRLPSPKLICKTTIVYTDQDDDCIILD